MKVHSLLPGLPRASAATALHTRSLLSLGTCGLSLDQLFPAVSERVKLIFINNGSKNLALVMILGGDLSAVLIMELSSSNFFKFYFRMMR